MKKLITMGAAVAVLALTSAAQAAMVDQAFSWSNTDGYSMLGTMNYDDTYGFISAVGGDWDNGKVQSMTVSFYSGPQLLETIDQVVNGNIEYEYLKFGYDTETRTFDPEGYDIDMGWDDDYYTCYLAYDGDAGYHLNSYGGDSHGGTFVPSAAPPAVPEPAFFQMGALLGMSGLGCLKLRRKA